MFVLTKIILQICLTYLPNFLETAEVLHCLPSYWSPYLRWHSIFKTNSPQTFRAISSRCRKVHFRLPAALARAPWLLDGNPALKAIAPGCNKVIRGNCSLPSGGNPTWAEAYTSKFLCCEQKSCRSCQPLEEDEKPNFSNLRLAALLGCLWRVECSGHPREF